MLDGSGFVRGSKVFNGNGREPKALKGLKAPKEALVIKDRAIATKDNIGWLRQESYRYWVVSRERTRAFNLDGASTVITVSDRPVQVKKAASEDGQEARLYCYSKPRAKIKSAVSPGALSSAWRPS